MGAGDGARDRRAHSQHAVLRRQVVEGKLARALHGQQSLDAILRALLCEVGVVVADDRVEPVLADLRARRAKRRELHARWHRPLVAGLEDRALCDLGARLKDGVVPPAADRLRAGSGLTRRKISGPKERQLAAAQRQLGRRLTPRLRFGVVELRTAGARLLLQAVRVLVLLDVLVVGILGKLGQAWQV